MKCCNARLLEPFWHEERGQRAKILINCFIYLWVVSHWHRHSYSHFYRFIACYIQHADLFRGTCKERKEWSGISSFVWSEKLKTEREVNSKHSQSFQFGKSFVGETVVGVFAHQLVYSIELFEGFLFVVSRVIVPKRSGAQLHPYRRIYVGDTIQGVDKVMFV